jgi:hypothetical protein
MLKKIGLFVLMLSSSAAIHPATAFGQDYYHRDRDYYAGDGWNGSRRHDSWREERREHRHWREHEWRERERAERRYYERQRYSPYENYYGYSPYENYDNGDRYNCPR